MKIKQFKNIISYILIVVLFCNNIMNYFPLLTSYATENDLATNSNAKFFDEYMIKTDSNAYASVSTDSDAEQEEKMMLLPNGIEIPKEYSYIYKTTLENKKLTVFVYAKDESLRDAELVVKMLNNNEESYKTAESALNEKNLKYDDIIAIDIHFELNGSEMEPNENVYVYIEANEIIPKTAIVDSVSIHHIEENDTQTEAVDVIRENISTLEINENMEEDKSDIISTFSIDTFSTFTITWQNNEEYPELSMQIVNENGVSITSSVTKKIISSDEKDKWFHLVDLSPEDISGYQYKEARIESATNGDIITKIKYNSENNEWYYLNGVNGDGNSLEDNTIYLIYKNDSYINIANYKKACKLYWDETTGTKSQNGSKDNHIESIKLNNLDVTWANSGEKGFRMNYTWDSSAKTIGDYYPNASTTNKETKQLVIKPKAGYYVSQVTFSCCPQYYTPYNCQTWERGCAFDQIVNISFTGETIIDIPVLAFCHLGNLAPYHADSYFILVKTEVLPSPLYIEYDYGNITDLIGDNEIFLNPDEWTDDNSENYYGSYYTTNGKSNNDGMILNDTKMKYKYLDENTEAQKIEDLSNWKHITNKITDKANQETRKYGYKFDKWHIEYFESCEENDGDFTFSNFYSEDYISENEELNTFMHMKLTAIWRECEKEDIPLTSSLEVVKKINDPLFINDPKDLNFIFKIEGHDINGNKILLFRNVSFLKESFTEDENGYIVSSEILNNIPASNEYKITEIKVNEYELKSVTSENENVTIIDKYALTDLTSINNASITFFSEKEYLPTFSTRKAVINSIPGSI